MSALPPTADQLRWAERVLAHTDGCVALLEGQMVDKPVVERARALLRRAAIAGRRVTKGPGRAG